MTIASYQNEKREWCKYAVTYNLQTKAFEKGVPPNVHGIVPKGHVIEASYWKFEDPMNRADRYIPTRLVGDDKCRQFLEYILEEAFTNAYTFPIGSMSPQNIIANQDLPTEA